MTPFSLATERLVMRHLTVDDAPLMLDLLNSAGWLQFIGDRGVRNVEDARRYIETRLLASYARHGFGHYHLARRSDGVALGICGLVKRDTLEDPDVGFALLPNHAGHGYATEATAGVIRFAQKSLGLRRLVAVTQGDNARSIRLLAKLEFTFERLVRLSDDVVDLQLHAREFPVS